MIASRLAVIAMAISISTGASVAVAAPAADWGLIDVFPMSGQAVFVDTANLGGSTDSIRTVDVAAIFARDVGRDSGYIFTAEIDCRTEKLRARSAKTFDKSGKKLAHDDTIGSWGSANSLAFGARLVAYACRGEKAPERKFGAQLPVTEARALFAAPKAG